MYIGNWKNKEREFKDIEWAKNIKALGVIFGYNINYEELWLQKFTKFKEKISQWKRRNLTIFGKNMLLSPYVFSSLNYMLEMYPHHIPPDMGENVKALCCEFIWGN